jgi:YD repeat-containing protein
MNQAKLPSRCRQARSRSTLPSRACSFERIQTLGNASSALTRTTQHHYDSAGRLNETTLPSGAVIGCACGVDVWVLTITVNGVTLVRDIETFPFSKAKAWIDRANANGFRHARGYDTDSRVAPLTPGDDSRALSDDVGSS